MVLSFSPDFFSDFETINTELLMLVVAPVCSQNAGPLNSSFSVRFAAIQCSKPSLAATVSHTPPPAHTLAPLVRLHFGAGELQVATGQQGGGGHFLPTLEGTSPGCEHDLLKRNRPNQIGTRNEHPSSGSEFFLKLGGVQYIPLLRVCPNLGGGGG